LRDNASVAALEKENDKIKKYAVKLDAWKWNQRFNLSAPPFLSAKISNDFDDVVIGVRERQNLRRRVNYFPFLLERSGVGDVGRDWTI
jgi:hypothetical protein